MNIIATKTQGKLKKLIAKFDNETGATMKLAMGGINLAGKREALASLDTVANEIKRLYAGLKSVITASNKAFMATTEDETIASMVSDLAIIATRIDLATAAITAEIEAEVETVAEVEEDEEVSTSDILDELGIEDIEEGGDEVPSEEEILEEEVEDLEEEILDETEEEEIIEDLEEEFEEDDGILDDEEEVLIEAKKETFKAKRQALKRVVTVSKDANPLTELFNFMK